VGNWRPEHLFTLKQSRELYRTYQQLIVGCDLEIETMLRAFEPRTDPVKKPLPSDRKRNRAGKKRRKKNGHPNPGVDLRTLVSGYKSKRISWLESSSNSD
jgi:hypothetical protein